MSAKTCPKCGLFNPASAQRCDCGYDFETKTVQTPFSAKAPRAARTISETRVTCLACGNVWHYGKAEALESAGAALQNAGKSMMCCTGCGPALFLPNAKVTDLARCQKCGSRAVKSERVDHAVPL